MAEPRGPVPVATRAQVTADTAGNEVLRRPDALALTVLRTRSLHGRELLVEQAWPGRSAEEIHEWADRAMAGTAGLEEGMDPHALGQYARVLAMQSLRTTDLARGRVLLEALAACDLLDALPAHAVQILLHLRVVDRDQDGARALMDHSAVPEDVAAAARADLANPELGGGGAEDWLPLVDRALHDETLAPLRLADARGAEHLFDRLSTDPLPPVEDGPLVTVVVSTYDPGAPLLTAVRSLTAQTWRRLEILVVDDASPDRGAAEGWLQQVEQLDDRVRVIRKAVNGGTYRARNTAWRQARGAYLTTLDSDDWLHPQAIELLVTELESDPALMACRGHGARVGEDLRLVRLGYRHRAVAAPTLMVRLDPVVGRLGFFDPARKAADTEYARRIQAAFGRSSVATLPACLLLLRSGESTLSSSEFSRLWRHGARHAYKTVYGPWHEEIAAGAPAWLDPAATPLVEPRRWIRPRDEALPPPRHLDLVLGGDWRRLGGPQRSMLEEIRAAREAGLRVGILHLEAMRFATTRDLPLCAPVVDLIRSGEVEWVQLDDDVEVDVLQVRYPLVLQHPPHVPGGAFTPRHLLIMANQAPLEPDGSDQRYVVADVTARARELFRVTPRWVPQGPVLREVLAAQDPDIDLVPWDNPGLIDADEWDRRGDRPAAEVPVVGRFSRDHELKHPATRQDLLAAYDLGPGYRVRMMGSLATWRALCRAEGLAEDTPVPESWEMVRAGSVPAADFLDGLDFFVYQDHPERHEAFGRVLLEAAASGLVVIAHPKHRPVFGDLLDYAEPAGVREILDGYVADPGRHRARVAEIRERVRERFGHAGYISRLGSLPEGVAEGRHVADDPVRTLADRWAAARSERASRGAVWRGAVVLTLTPVRGQRLPVAVSVAPVGLGPAMSGDPVGVHAVPLRSSADAGRPDAALIVGARPACGATVLRLREALAVRADAEVDAALRRAVEDSDDLPAVILVRDGRVEVVASPGVEVSRSGWPLTEGPVRLRLAHDSALS